MPDPFYCPTCWRVDSHSIYCKTYWDSHPPKTVKSTPLNLATSNTVFRHGRAGKPGRPPVPTAEQKIAARERQRAYRKAKQT